MLIVSRTLRAFYSSPAHPAVGDVIELCEEESLHLAKVLRVESQQSVEVLDGHGHVLKGKCVQALYHQVQIEISEIIHCQQDIPNIRMGVALTKGGRWDDLVRPLTELGVASLVPLLTVRTEVKVEEGKFKNREKKWTKLAIEACKQSGNPWLPTISSPMTVDDFIDRFTLDTPFWTASLQAGVGPIKLPLKLDSICLLVGPEGGWTAEEESMMQKRGGHFFSLGPHTLRVENASIAALAVARSAQLA